MVVVAVGVGVVVVVVVGVAVVVAVGVAVGVAVVVGVGVGVVVVAVVVVAVVVAVAVGVGVGVDLIQEATTMKKIVEEVSGEGLIKLMGERVTLFCLNYIYTGKLVGVNETCVLLADPSIVYETGTFTEKNWKDAQPLPNEMYVMLSAVESFGIVK